MLRGIGMKIVGIGVACVILGLASCSGVRQKPITKDTPKLGRFTNAEIQENAEALLVETEVGDELRLKISKRLGELLADPGLAPQIEEKGVSAVGAFNVGTGGVIVKMGSGGGLVNFAGGRQKVKFKAKGFAAGASIGGEGIFGIVLAVGMEYEEKFQDRYKCIATGSTVGESSFRVGRGTPDQGTHMVHFCGAGIGFSMDAGGSVVTITTES